MPMVLTFCLSWIAFSWLYFVPIYNGYLVAYIILTIARFRFKPKGQIFFKKNTHVNGLFFSLILIEIFLIGDNSSAPLDVLRDCGALYSFYLGYRILPYLSLNRRGDWRNRLLEVLSTAGFFVSVFTLLGVISALKDGADAYTLRAYYIIYAHMWLPFLFLINFGLTNIHPSKFLKYSFRMWLCFFAIVASLSRTDFVLVIVLLACIVFVKRRFMLNSPIKILAFLVGISLSASYLPALLELDVVNQRVAASTDLDSDTSMGWRVIENNSFMEMMSTASIYNQIFGFGLGSRMPLPVGIFDFDGRDSIPHLHNSLFTITMKFGFLGLLCFTIVNLVLISISWKLRSTKYNTYSSIGVGMLFISLVKGVTLHGLSEWSHLIFYGIGCVLISSSAAEPQKLS